jgi:L-cysteine S-thiosulfotransferase
MTGFAALVPTISALFLFAVAAVAAEISPEERRSGSEFAGPETRAMENDDTANPGMLWVLQGASLWDTATGAAAQSCADCHGDARTSMRGVATHYPAFDRVLAKPLDLEQRINRCRTEHQKAEPLAWGSPDLLALTAFVVRQSHGLSIVTGSDPELRPSLQMGRQLFDRREGQLNLSCSQCHDDNWGKRLAGNLIPQGHPTGYPVYRLEWQSLGSLQRRLRNCMTGVRAEPFEYGAPEAVALELYLMERARGMPIETPAVRP